MADRTPPTARASSMPTVVPTVSPRKPEQISGRENWIRPPSKYWYTLGRSATGMVSTP